MYMYFFDDDVFEVIRANRRTCLLICQLFCFDAYLEIIIRLLILKLKDVMLDKEGIRKTRSQTSRTSRSEVHVLTECISHG